MAKSQKRKKVKIKEIKSKIKIIKIKIKKNKKESVGKNGVSGTLARYGRRGPKPPPPFRAVGI